MLRTLFALPLLLTTGCIIAIDIPHDEWDDSGLHVTHIGDHGRHRQGGEISGRVVDASGAPVAAHVTAVYDSGSYGQSCQTDGSFALGPLPAGEVNVKATTADGGYAIVSSLELERDDHVRDLELRLEPGATLALSYQGGAESYRCALFHEGLRVDDFTLRRGEQTTIVVPAGRVPMQLYQDGAIFAVHEAHTTAGSWAEVVFQVD